VIAINAQSVNYQALASDFLINATGGAAGITITLPNPPNVGQILVVKKVDSGVGVVTVAAPAGTTIDGAASFLLATQYFSVTVISVSSTVFEIIAEVV
jgi:hypothetical protein